MNQRIQPKKFSSGEFELRGWEDDDANLWSLEEVNDKGEWMVIADIYDRKVAALYDLHLRSLIAKPYTEEEALTGSYIITGAESHPQYNGINPILGGDIAIHSALLAFGRQVEDVWLREFSHKDIDFVWNYEVSEAVGRWIVDYVLERKVAPSSEEVANETLRIALKEYNR